MEKHFNIFSKAPSGFGCSFAKYFENGLTCRDRVMLMLYQFVLGYVLNGITLVAEIAKDSDKKKR